MSASDQRYSLDVESNITLSVDEKTLHPAPIPATPTLSSILARIGPLPREGLFLGVAEDALPVLLNLYDPMPGPLLICGETGAGKTQFLRSIAQSVLQTHQPDELQYAVITKHTDEWDSVEKPAHQLGVYQVDDPGTPAFIGLIASKAHENQTTDQCILLLIDDLEEMAKLDLDTLQHLRWLLARGPSRRVWPIVTMNADRYGQVLSWIPSFRTRIFGRIKTEHIAEAVGGDKDSAFDQLEAPNQFSLRENGGWIRFELAQP